MSPVQALGRGPVAGWLGDVHAVHEGELQPHPRQRHADSLARSVVGHISRAELLGYAVFDHPALVRTGEAVLLYEGLFDFFCTGEAHLQTQR